MHDVNKSFQPVNNTTKISISYNLPKVSKVDHTINNYENSTQYNLPVQLVHNSTTVPTSPGASWTDHMTNYKINTNTHTQCQQTIPTIIQ